MKRDLTIYFTTDTHGYFSAMDYATGVPENTGICGCRTTMKRDENTLVIDAGDILQGSPFIYWLQSAAKTEECVAAKVMNLAGYDIVTIGNHDFNYGKDVLERYLSELNAICVCANVEGVAGVRKTAVITMPNGLRVGVTGIVTEFVNLWEKPENLVGVQVTDVFAAAEAALAELKAQKVDVTVCIYHGGFENDLKTGAVQSATKENQAYRICRDLDFDVLLTGHQHRALADICLFGTYTCQTPDRARQFAAMRVQEEDGKVTARSELIDAGEADPEIAAYLAPFEQENAAYLDTPVGFLDEELQPSDHLDMALNGSLIANFFNQVQLEASGADISCTCLGNKVKGFDRRVTIRDIVSTYIYPNTLVTIEVGRTVLKAALERCAEYFDRDEQGKLTVGRSFLEPMVEHYNFDHFLGIEVSVDLRRDMGDRVTSIRYQGEELAEDRKLTLCLNNYRVTGAGGYPLYAKCPVVKEQPTEIAQMIVEYVEKHRDITIVKDRWLQVQQ